MTPPMLPRLLLTNDDGIDAPGIALLAEIARKLAHEVWIIAPESNQSGTGQNVSLHKKLRCHRRAEMTWAVEGTPSDCVALALTHFMADRRPTLVLSGINAGANLGDEVNMSGTIGAALTALMLGTPSIAISQACPNRNQIPWPTSKSILPKILEHLLEGEILRDSCLSVNIPPIPPEEIAGLSWARQSHRNIGNILAEQHAPPEEAAPHEAYFSLSLDRRPAVMPSNSDSAIMRRGEVAITALSLDRSVDTAHPSIVFHGSGSGDTETGEFDLVMASDAR